MATDAEIIQWILKGGPGSGAPVGHMFEGNQWSGNGEALRSIRDGQNALQGAVGKGAGNLSGDRYYGSVQDDDHIADAKANLVEGHTKLAINALRRGDTNARTAHLAAAHAASSMPDPDHADTSQNILEGAKNVLAASNAALQGDAALSYKEANGL